ncbi:MAG: AAA family ATPase [Candidatus Micrarchaeota archaeon]|nr:AAA family ATPase [Candidatus Micrarchaeota archaeon]
MHNYKSIVISGLPASGKSTLVRALAKDYNMPTYSAGDTLKAMYARMHPEKEITFEEFWRKMSLEENRKFDEGLKAMFEDNSLVGDSRYTSYLDRTKCMLVFVSADMKTRSLRALLRSEYEGMTVESVSKVLRMREEDELKTGIGLFGIDYRDPGQYHITMNSGMLSIRQEVDTIKAAFESKTIHL